MSPRPLLLLVVPVAVGAFVLGSTTGSPIGSDPTPGRTLLGGGTVAAAYTGTDVDAADSCDALLERYVERGVDAVGPWGWGGGHAYSEEGDVAGDSSSAVEDVPAPLTAPTEAGTVRQTNEASGTNVQESGVDEPDSVKTDGVTLFRVDGGDLTTYDVTGAEVMRSGSVDLPRMRDAEILLAGSTVLAIAQDEDGETTRTAVVDVSDPTAPTVEHTYDYDTALVTARMHGTGDAATIRLVLQSGLPDLDFTEPGRSFGIFGGSEDAATRDNQDVVRASTLDDWLPQVSTDGGDPEQLLGCGDVGLPDDGAGLSTIAIVGFAASDPDAASATGLAVDTGIAYASTDRLYLATSALTAGWSECLDLCVPSPMSITADDGYTHLYAFALSGRDATYVASGEVDGVVRDRWSIDEHDGVVRLAVGPSSRTADANSVVTLAEEGDDLVERGRVDGLGPDEQIQSVRWFDALAIVVTFRETDPLYAVDLTDVDAPTLLGELKIPGFSAYLHPLGTDRLIGVGEGPGTGGWGAQMGLFDVTDLTDPQRIALTHYGRDTYAAAASDPRQLTWLPDARTVLTVIGDWSDSGSETGYVSVVRLDDGTMTNEMVEVEHGDEISDVRLVPLPDGRVVLATGDDASFFAL